MCDSETFCDKVVETWICAVCTSRGDYVGYLTGINFGLGEGFASGPDRERDPI